MAKFIKSDESISDAYPANGSYFTLEELQGFVGGYIQIVSTADPNIFLVVDEDGLAKNLPINYVATRIYREAMHRPRRQEIPAGAVVIDLGEMIGADPPVVGDVLVCARAEIR